MPAPLIFTAEETDLLGRTADALSAYLGKPVLAQIMDADENGFEWVVFAIPLQPHDTPEDDVIVEIGGNHARLLGSQGGLDISDGSIFDCQYLWAIQLCQLEHIRFIKVDQEGDEVAWTETLAEILPFDIADPVLSDDLDDDINDDNDDEGKQDAPRSQDIPILPLPPSTTLH